MKNYPQTIIDALEADSMSAFIVLDLQLNPAIRWTTLPYDVVIGEFTYSGKAKLVSFDLPRHDQAVGRDSYKVTIADTDNSVQALLTANGIGAPMRIRIGVLNDYTPNLQDFAEIYSGSVDTFNVSQSDSARLLTVQGVSPAGALSFTRAIYTDTDYIRQQNSGDTSMNAVGSTTAEAVTLGWGRIP
jgi:hypothetical protein